MHNRFEICAFSQAEMNRKHIKLTAYCMPSILKHFIQTNYLIFTTTLRQQALFITPFRNGKTEARKCFVFI